MFKSYVLLPWECKPTKLKIKCENSLIVQTDCELVILQLINKQSGKEINKVISDGHGSWLSRARIMVPKQSGDTN